MFCYEFIWVQLVPHSSLHLSNDLFAIQGHFHKKNVLFDNGKGVEKQDH